MSELKRSEVLCFDDGVLTVKMSGYGRTNGWATLAFNEQQFELNDEGYQVVEIPPSELYELRDFLNRVLTERPGDSPARSVASRVIRKAETKDGINIIIDEKWAAYFPKESESQVDLLLEMLGPRSVTGAVACIKLRPSEIQSGLDRVRWAEGLIRQLPENHDGRNSWLLNYAGDKHEQDKTTASPPDPAVREIPDDELAAWARNWHWNDTALDQPVDPSIYFRDMRMLKAYIAKCRAALPSDAGDQP